MANIPFTGGSAPPEEESIEVEMDGVKLAPVVYESEVSGTAKMTEYTDQCGYSESDKLGPGTVTITAQALLYKPVVQWIYEIYEVGDSVEVTHPAGIGTLELNIQDFTFVQQGDHNEFVDEDGIEREVFDTQIQFKSPNAETE